MNPMYILVGFLFGIFCYGLGLFMGWIIWGMGRPNRKQMKVDEIEKRKAERLRQGFQQMMSYDVSTAYGKKVE